MVTIQTDSSAGQIIPCTEKFLKNLCADLSLRLKEKKDKSLEDDQVELFLKKAEKLLKMPVCEPNHTGNVIKLGNAAMIIIDKRPPKFVLFDGAVVLQKELPPEQTIINFNSPLGRELKHKKKFYSGNFKENGKVHNVKILKIFSYKEAKEIFFPKELVA